MPEIKDGPASPLFTPLDLKANITLEELPPTGVSDLMIKNARQAPSGDCVHWGMPFNADNIILAKDAPVTVDLNTNDLGTITARWLVFSHLTDISDANRKTDKTVELFGMDMPLLGPMGTEEIANYIFIYQDGSEVPAALKCGFQIGAFATRLDENCFEAVTHAKAQTTRWQDNDLVRNQLWGRLQQQTFKTDFVRSWINWLWAWENPHPEKPLKSLRIEPRGRAVLIFGISAGDISARPIRWSQRQKAILQLPEDEAFDPAQIYHGTTGLPLQDGIGGYHHIAIDMGQIISLQPRSLYPTHDWAESDYNSPPELSKTDIIVEYTSHPEAHFHMPGGQCLAIDRLETKRKLKNLRALAPANRKISFRIVDKINKRPVSVKLHIHGPSGEYLAPQNRHRIANANWYESEGADYVHLQTHFCSYINGETDVFLPEGEIYLEITKGFEVIPVRRTFKITPDTEKLEIEIENTLNWRQKGWITADTHVHFLSPQTAQLEGAAEGVNVINLLASQWGEMMTNVGDFDGKTTFGETPGSADNDYMVRVGTENRQSVLGHISLLGYEDQMILPLASGGPSESALGDSVEALLTDWAQQCKKQNGTVIIPHFPLPRGEHAATIVDGSADAVELSSLGGIAMGGISPYSLADWYRYLNCGYFVGAVGGTDKMSAATAVGAARTYAKLAEGEIFDYRAWQNAVERGHTFVTLGPLIDFNVEGHPPGSRINMPTSGGTVDISWQADSITLPLSKIDLIINGKIHESEAINDNQGVGHWRVKIDKNTWIALLARSRAKDGDMMITAHSSPVMIYVEGSEFMVPQDAMCILEQIEGSLAYLDSIGTKADIQTYQAMRLKLSAIHRKLHNRLHAAGVHHHHNVQTDHDEHH